MTTPLQDRLLGEIDAELEDARLAMAQAQDRIDEAQALREVFVELLTPPAATQMDAELHQRAAAADLRRQILAALEEQTPHSAYEVTERIGLDANADDRRIPKKVGYHLQVLADAGRVKLAGSRPQRADGKGGRPARFYVKVSLNGDGEVREREITWP